MFPSRYVYETELVTGLRLFVFKILYFFLNLHTRELNCHRFNSALEFEDEGLTLGEGPTKLIEFTLCLLQLSGEIILEFFRVHIEASEYVLL